MNVSIAEAMLTFIRGGDPVGWRSSPSYVGGMSKFAVFMDAGGFRATLMNFAESGIPRRKLSEIFANHSIALAP